MSRASWRRKRRRRALRPLKSFWQVKFSEADWDALRQMEAEDEMTLREFTTILARAMMTQRPEIYGDVAPLLRIWDNPEDACYDNVPRETPGEAGLDPAEECEPPDCAEADINRT